MCLTHCLYVFTFCFQSDLGWSGILLLIYYLDLNLKTRVPTPPPHLLYRDCLEVAGIGSQPVRQAQHLLLRYVSHAPGAGSSCPGHLWGWGQWLLAAQKVRQQSDPRGLPLVSTLRFTGSAHG